MTGTDDVVDASVAALGSELRADILTADVRESASRPPERSVPGLSLVLVLILAACGGPRTVGAGQGEFEWVGETFESTSIHGTSSTTITSGTPIRLTIERRGRAMVLRWHAGCNHWYAPVNIGPERFEVHAGWESTLMGCPDAGTDRDRWLADFFDADPTWHRQDRTLTLETRGATIEFTETGEG